MNDIENVDAIKISEAIADGTRLRNGIKTMRETMRNKYEKCTPDQGVAAFPYVLDIKHSGVLIVPQMCDEGKARFITVHCSLYSPESLKYSIRKNGSRYMESCKTLAEALSIVELFIYGKLIHSK